MTVVISGFPGVGKSFATCGSDVRILDSDSSVFSWISPGVRDPKFPENYMEHIRSNNGSVDVIFVSSHEVVRDALRENRIPYVLVYPRRDLKAEYIQRYRMRGSDEKFIEFISAHWDEFLDSIEKETYPRLEQLGAGMYVSDILDSLLIESDEDELEESK